MTTYNPFIDAEKIESKLRLAITGPAGSGKTYTALALATYTARALGVEPNIYLIDTENGSAAKYAPHFKFKTVYVGPHSGGKWNNYHPKHVIELMGLAYENGANFVIIDSLSHFWQGEGGVLDLADEGAKTMKGNSWAGWKVSATPYQNKLVQAILTSPVHVIGTMRTRVEYAQVDENGRKTIKKLGTAPIQREGADYEFDIVLNMDTAHAAIVDKNRGSRLGEKLVWNEPGEEVAVILAEFLQGKPDVYFYGDGTPVPQNGVTRGIFDEYKHKNGIAPSNSDELRRWHDSLKVEPQPS